MASITKRGKTWQYTVSHYVDGKYKPIRKGGFLKEKDAKNAAMKVELELAEGVSSAAHNDIFSAYFKSWMDDFKSNRSPQTIDRYKTTLETLKEHFPAVTLQSMNKRKYQAFLNVYGESHALSTMKKLNSHIRACVKEAVDEGRIRADFTRGVELKSKIPEKKEAEKFLNFKDSKLLVAFLRKHVDRSPLYALLLLALASGLRFGELLGLKRTDFNFEENVISVRRAWDYKKKTGFAPLKNEHSERDVDVDRITMQFFKEYFEETPPNVLGLVFYNTLSRDGSFTNNAANKTLRKALAGIGLTENGLTVHGLRHTFVSILLYKRVSINYIAEQAGHKNTLVTQETYSHVLDELRDEEKEIAAKVMEDLFGEKVV